MFLGSPILRFRSPIKNRCKVATTNIRLSRHFGTQQHYNQSKYRKYNFLLKPNPQSYLSEAINSSIIFSSCKILRWPHSKNCITRSFQADMKYFQGSVYDEAHIDVNEKISRSSENVTDADLQSDNNLISSQEIASDGQSGKKTKKKKFKGKRFMWAQWNRPEVHLDINTEKAILEGKMKCRKKKIKVVDPPEDVTNTINRILKGDVGGEIYGDIGDQFPHYYEAGINFKRYIDSRKPVLEEKTKRINRDRIEARVRRDMGAHKEGDLGSTYDELQFETDIQKKTETLFQRRIATLEAQAKHIQYDVNASWAYLLGKASFDYATMYNIMSDIKKRTGQLSTGNKLKDNVISETETDKVQTPFQPRTLFDFGSGVGTSLWAAKEIFGEMSEVFCVDSSQHMTDMAISLILKGHKQHTLPAGYTFRVHIPRDDLINYDLVTCSHTLLHIPTELERINIVDNLWRKTSNGGFLILAENGTNAGFQVIQEARHYLSQIIQQNEPDTPSQDVADFTDFAVTDDESVGERNDSYSDERCFQQRGKDHNLIGHLFSPCPHTKTCPRYEFDSIPCNFDFRYRNFPLEKINKSIRDNVNEGRYSYLVFRKGVKTEDCEWPRVVEPVKSCNHGHSICRMCTPRGTLEELLISNINAEHKNNRLLSKKLLGKYSKSLKCGDQFKGHLESGFEEYEDFIKWATSRITKHTVSTNDEE